MGKDPQVKQKRIWDVTHTHSPDRTPLKEPGCWIHMLESGERKEVGMARALPIPLMRA
jgi:hypothetical protein